MASHTANQPTAASFFTREGFSCWARPPICLTNWSSSSLKLLSGVHCEVSQISPDAYDLPESRLSLTAAYRIEIEEFQVFLSSFFQILLICYSGRAKPKFVPPSRDDSMAEIAQSDYVFWDIRPALRTWRYVVCVQNAIRITSPIAANLALLAVALLDPPGELLPMAA